MDKEIQRKLNLNLGNLLKNVGGYEIYLTENYILSFEKQGYDVDYFKKKIKLIKVEKLIFRKIEKELIESFNKNLQLN